MWTDDIRKLSFTSLTVHYITENFELKERVLSTKAFPIDQKKSGENILVELTKMLRDAGISSIKKLIFVSDRGANIVKVR